MSKDITPSCPRSGTVPDCPVQGHVPSKYQHCFILFKKKQRKQTVVRLSKKIKFHKIYNLHVAFS